MLRFTDNRYQSAHDVTIGVEFGARILSVIDDKSNTTKNLKCQIWDTAGQESFKSITRYIPTSTVANIDRIIEVRRGLCWYMILRDLLHLLLRLHGYRTYELMRILILLSVCVSGVLLIEVLVGNKADLAQERKVTTEEARQWANENDVSVCVESSAKSGDGVEDAFQRVAEEVFHKIRDGVFDLTDKVISFAGSADGSQRGSK